MWDRMYFAPPIDYDRIMKCVPYGKVITVGKFVITSQNKTAQILQSLLRRNFCIHCSLASYQRSEDETPY